LKGNLLLEQAFRIEDANGQAFAYVYFRKDENEARQATVPTHDEARRIAASPSCPSCCPARLANDPHRRPTRDRTGGRCAQTGIGEAALLACQQSGGTDTGSP
jgi:hypothetical protein